MKQHLASCLIILNCLLWPSIKPLTAATPNILIIYADDLGYGDVQCYNPDRGLIPTPNIDRLAREGMRFTDAHSSSGVCSPSRYTLLTGRYHWRTSLQSGIVGLWGKPLITPDRLTMAGLAKKSGYNTACIGKWHLGWDWPIPKDALQAMRANHPKDAQANDEQRSLWASIFSKPIEGGPITRGFDRYFGTDVPNWPPYCFIDQDRTVGIPSEFLGAPQLARNQASKQGPALKNWRLEPILPALAEQASAFIKKEASTPEPFLLYVPLTSPHTPLSVNDEWKGQSGLNLYADMVMETDAVVGRILKALEDSGQVEQTLVLFTSDNGCAPYIDVDQLESKGHFPSGPLRGYKSDAWEGGHRVPFIVRWPNVVQPGSANHHLIHQADWVATLSDILQQPLAADQGEDSFSLVPLLKGGHAPVREHAVSCSIRGIPSIRKGDWKLVLDKGSGGWTKGETETTVQLYNLSKDIAESNNLAATQPDKVEELGNLLEHLIEKGRSNPGPEQSNDVNVKRYPITP